MLKSLSISNLAVIAETKIEFESGLNILTGETGAGKSIIIDAINLILGARTSRDIIRTGETKAKVEALFYVDENIRKELEESGIECEEELVISREIHTDGKNVIRINGSLANTSMLRAIGEKLVDIHGQHDNKMLMDSEMHIKILDDYAETDKEIKEYNDCFFRLKEVSGKIKSLTSDTEERERRISLLEYETECIRKAKLKKGEFEELSEKRKIISNFVKISEGTEKVYNLLSGGNSILELLGKAVKEMSELAGCNSELSEIDKNINQVYYSAEELARDIAALRSDFEYTDEEIDRIEKRADELNDIKRRFGSSYEEITAFYEKAKEELDTLKNTEENTKMLEEELSRLKSELKEKGMKLSEKRKKKAKELQQVIIKELSELNMPDARFETAFSMTEKFYKDGIDKVEFLLSVNPGIAPGKLSKIASGGELSRIMLGISSALLGKYGVSTMIYDEIDTGVSGRAAQKIAEKMWRVSKDRQVLGVTHLPQIAAMADSHFHIAKEVKDNITRTGVTVLDREGRIKEIARITGGVSVNDATLVSAGDMLLQCENLKKSVGGVHE